MVAHSIYILEEHNEAFFLWNWAKRTGILSEGHALLHVDEHADLGTPRLKSSIKNLNGDLDKLVDVTYNQTSIASFITPAVYQGLINEVYWVRQKHKIAQGLPRRRYRYVRSFNQEGKRLMVGQHKDCGIDDPDRKDLIVSCNHLDDMPSNTKVILDIDLDFFSTIENPAEYRKSTVEITQEEYEKFTSDHYYPLRYVLLGSMIEPIKKEGRYYYAINNYDEGFASKLKVEENVIVERINLFVDALKEKEIEPILVDICRSKYSGYTPSDQCDFIQDELISRLRGHYNIEEECHISTLVPLSMDRHGKRHA